MPTRLTDIGIKDNPADIELTIVLVNGRWEWIRKDWWESLSGHKPPISFDNDGCTVVADISGDVLLWPACVIHDWHYSPKCKEVTNRLVADYHFLKNTYKIQRFQDVDRLRASARALKRFVGVRKLGEPHFKRPFQRY